MHSYIGAESRVAATQIALAASQVIAMFDASALKDFRPAKRHALVLTLSL